MASLVLQQLDRYGPEHCQTLSYAEASAYATRLVHEQYENFSVISAVVPARLRADFAHVYAFCRWADDLGDETGDPRKSLELLEWWRAELRACYAGRPRHPVYIALAKTIERHDIPAKPFDDLIDAFVQDQKVTRYRTWDQTVDYCTRSADPVGRLVLYLCGYRDEARQRLSDKTCTALQLINFWQDVRRDILDRDRIYIPADTLAKHYLTHQHIVDHVRGLKPLTIDQRSEFQRAMRELVERTKGLFAEGRALWPMLAADVRMSIQLFSLGGESIVRLVESQHYDTLDHRPSLSKGGKARLLMKVIAAKWFGGGV
ncbi:MAG: squalene synthase HpnC [Planctomycetes bacterium]|nr:squalene synthase HpnC [Planctomycetota bacterium]